MELEYQDGVIILLKAYEKQVDEYQFNAYLNYKMTDVLKKQISVLCGAKDIKPTLTFDEWKKPVTTQSDKRVLITDDEKEKIREHTRNFGKRGRD